MTPRIPFLLVFVALLGVGLLAARGEAAIKVRKPVLLKDSSTQPASRRTRPAVTPRPEGSRTYYVGRVIFARGDQVVAEIPDGARERERLTLFDAGFRRRGKVMVLKPLESGVYLLQSLGARSAAPGDRLALESEVEAAIRVLGENRLKSYREFVALFPRSEHRPRMAREMFRLSMKQGYPTFPGSMIEGRVKLTEAVGRELSVGQVLVVLDRFIIARTDADGFFRIEGLPKLDESVQLTLRVKDEKFQTAKETTVELAGGGLVEAKAEVPLRVTPTALVGKVVDEHGAPLAGVEVWTAPYTVEALTDETGSFRITRSKHLDAGETGAETDQPLFGDDFEVFAHRKGYSVNRSLVAAESFQENQVPAIQLVRQDPRRQPVPELGLELRAYLEIDAASASQEGVAPKLNR